MKANTKPTDAISEKIYFPIDASAITLKAKDVLTLSCKISGMPQTKGVLACQSSVDDHKWHQENAKADGEVYNFKFECADGKLEKPVFYFIVLQEASDLIDKTVKLTIKDLKITHTPYEPGKEATKNIFTATDTAPFKPFDTQFHAADWQKVYDESNGDAKLVITYKTNDYTPSNDYDGMGVLAGWLENWTNTTDDLSEFALNTNCKKEDYKAGIEIKKEFDLKKILEKENTKHFTINVYKIKESEEPKITITSVDIKYTAK